MKFVDQVKIHLQAGNGGKGCVSFRREKFIPRGGPNGGDGGDGGDIVLQGNRAKSTLLDFHFQQYFKAETGVSGGGRDRHGRNGEAKVVEVPLGTIVKDAETGETLLEVLDEEPHVLFKGGVGGKGNARFKTSTHRVPMEFGPGEPGPGLWVVLELKLMADVGLVGFPNAGKSTLIRAISKARPKIADYPFTTLVPNLGVVRTAGFESFVVADIPGIIEGAHRGAGLGHRFLKHIERTALLLLMVPAAGPEAVHPVAQYRVLLEELRLFSPGLTDKPRAVALTKVDLVPPEEARALAAALRDAGGVDVFPISAVTGQGVPALVRHLAREVFARRSADTSPPPHSRALARGARYRTAGGCPELRDGRAGVRPARHLRRRAFSAPSRRKCASRSWRCAHRRGAGAAHPLWVPASPGRA
jgi:GTPase